MTTEVLINRDLISLIFTHANAQQYKTAIRICHLWYYTIKCPKREHQYMNVVATLVMRDPKRDWCPWIFAQMPLNIIELYLEHHSIDNIANDVSENRRLTIAFIKKYEDMLKFDTISRHITLTNDIIREFDDKLDWNLISRNNSLVNELIESQINKINLYDLSSHCKLSPEFIRKHADRFNWNILAQNDSLTLELINEHQIFAYLLLNTITLNKNLDLEFMIKNKNKFHKHSVPWQILSVDERQKSIDKWRINGQLFLKYAPMDEINKHTIPITYKYMIGANHNLTTEFLHKLCGGCVSIINTIDSVANLPLWNEFIPVRAFTITLAHKFAENDWIFNYKNLLFNPNIDIAFMEKYIERFKGVLYVESRDPNYIRVD